MAIGATDPVRKLDGGQTGKNTRYAEYDRRSSTIAPRISADIRRNITCAELGASRPPNSLLTADSRRTAPAAKKFKHSNERKNKRVNHCAEYLHDTQTLTTAATQGHIKPISHT